MLKRLAPGSAPDDHFTASPHCRVSVSASRARWSCWWLSSCRCRDCISRRCSEWITDANSRPRRSFHCQSRPLCDRLGQWAHWSCWWPSSCRCWDCISRRCLNAEQSLHPPQTIISAASPHCRVTVSGSGRVGRAGGRPTIGAGIVSPAGVQIDCCHPIHPRRSFHCQSRLPCERIGQRARWSCWWLSNYPCWDCICPPVLTVVASAPPQTIISAAGPDCCVTDSASGRVGRAGGRPTIRAGIVSPAGVQID